MLGKGLGLEEQSMATKKSNAVELGRVKSRD